MVFVSRGGISTEDGIVKNSGVDSQQLFEAIGQGDNQGLRIGTFIIEDENTIYNAIPPSSGFHSPRISKNAFMSV